MTQATSSADQRTALRRALRILKRTRGSDFSRYKPDLLLRRFLGRVDEDDLASFLERLAGDPEEQLELERSFKIGVTEFFRNPLLFEALKCHWVPKLLQRFESPLRIWVPGCSTGQEAYSLAMILEESLGADQNFRIFATDIDATSLDIGASGVYPAADVEQVGERRLDAHFEDVEEAQQSTGQIARYMRVRRGLRRRVVFSRHDVLTEASLEGMHLISCRNLLICLQEEAQRNVVQTAQDALELGGMLALGPSEFLTWPEGFRVIDRDQRLFERTESSAAQPSKR